MWTPLNIRGAMLNKDATGRLNINVKENDLIRNYRVINVQNRTQKRDTTSPTTTNAIGRKRDTNGSARRVKSKGAWVLYRNNVRVCTLSPRRARVTHPSEKKLLEPLVKGLNWKTNNLGFQDQTRARVRQGGNDQRSIRAPRRLFRGSRQGAIPSGG